MKPTTKQTERVERELSIVRGNVGLASIRQAQTSMELYGDPESTPMSMPELSKWWEREAIRLRFNRKMEVTATEYEFFLHELYARGFTYAQALRAELYMQLRDLPYAGRIPVLTLAWFYPTDEMLKGLDEALNAKDLVLLTRKQYQARLKAVYQQGATDQRKGELDRNRPDDATLMLLELKAKALGYLATIEDLQKQVTAKERELRYLRGRDTMDTDPISTDTDPPPRDSSTTVTFAS